MRKVKHKVKEEQYNFYKRFYDESILEIDNSVEEKYSNEELFYMSMSKINFLKHKSYNKLSVLNIQYRDNIISNENESVLAKYYYTMFKSIISNAKRFKLIEPHSNTISSKMLYKSFKCFNSSAYNYDKYKSDMNKIKDSNLFEYINDFEITIATNKKVFDATHAIYSDRIIKKGEKLPISKFTKECVYFLKSKPLRTESSYEDTQVISDIYVSKLLNITPAYVGRITKGFLKVYKVQVACGSGYYKIKENKTGYQFKLSVQGEIYSSKTVGSRMIANIYFKSKIVRDGKIIKKHRLSNNTSKEEKLKVFKKKTKVILNKFGYINTINKNIRLGALEIPRNNKLLTPYINLNIVNSDFEKVKLNVIKIVHLIEFANHLKERYNKNIGININENSIESIYRKLAGYYYNLNNRQQLTKIKFSMMNRIFIPKLGNSINKICRKEVLMKYRNIRK